MRARLVIVSAIVLAIPLTLAPGLPAAHGASIHIAQGKGNSVKQRPAQPSEKPKPSPSAKAAGPPWTYQMARISLVLLALIFLAMAGAYYQFVIKRRRGEV